MAGYENPNEKTRQGDMIMENGFDFAAEFDDAVKAASELVGTLKEKNLKTAAAESCTGGLFAALITSVPGASAVIDGSCVSYSEKIKTELVKVDSEIIEKYGVVSAETARAMARGAETLFHADIGVGITGWAGPDIGDDGKPAGTVCIAVSFGKTESFGEYHFDGTRLAVRLAASKKAAVLAREIIEKTAG